LHCCKVPYFNGTATGTGREKVRPRKRKRKDLEAMTANLGIWIACFFLCLPVFRLHGFLLINPLTPNNLYRGRTGPLTSKVAFYIFIQQILVLNILNMLYNLRFFSSKCSLFHNSKVFGYCIIRILYTGCPKIKKKYIIPAPKG